MNWDSLCSLGLVAREVQVLLDKEEALITNISQTACLKNKTKK